MKHLIAIIWLVAFLIWFSGGWYVYGPNGRDYRVAHNGLLAFLVGVLGYFELAGALK